jgi:hypothetical protein
MISKKLMILGFAPALLLGVSAQAEQCLIVRSSEGHRFRNSMIAGALTGGIGFAAGAAFSGGRYEYVDGVNVASPKMKYKGSELQKLTEQGVHVVVVNKKAKEDETKSARESCQAFVQQNSHPAAASTSATISTATVADASTSPTSPDKPMVKDSSTAEPEPGSVADAARRYREQKAQQQNSGQ